MAVLRTIRLTPRPRIRGPRIQAGRTDVNDMWIGPPFGQPPGPGVRAGQSGVSAGERARAATYPGGTHTG